MKTGRIKSPEGVKAILAELWRNRLAIDKSVPGHAYMVDFPEPTEEEKRLIAANRAASRPVVINEDALREVLEKSGEKLGGA